MHQPDLFTGDELRDFGIEAAERDRDQMVRLVDGGIEWVAKQGGPFTAETIRAGFGPNIGRHPDLSKVIGARIRAAATRGDIYTLGETIIAKRPTAHSRRLLIWYPKYGIEGAA